MTTASLSPQPGKARSTDGGAPAGACPGVTPRGQRDGSLLANRQWGLRQPRRQSVHKSFEVDAGDVNAPRRKRLWRVPAALLAEIRNAYEAGDPHREIASRFGVSVATVAKNAARNRWNRPKPAWATEPPPAWRSAFERGVEVAALRILMGCSDTGIYKTADRWNWDRDARRRAIADRPPPTRPLPEPPIVRLVQLLPEAAPCGQGHRRRSARTGKCLECQRAIEARRRKNDPESVKRANAKWAREHRDVVHAARRRRYTRQVNGVGGAEGTGSIQGNPLARGHLDSR